MKTVPGMNVQSWDDVNRLDVRPGRGVVKPIFIESIHDGSIFLGDWTKLGLFLPTGLAVFALWLTGMWMWWIPFSRKCGVKRRREAAAVQHL